MAINSGRSRLAACVALAYTLVIVYASLQPFGGWRMRRGGAVLGAAGAWIFSIPAVSRHPLAMLRRRIIRTDVAGDCGLIALAVWLFIQFDPAPLALASGDLRDALGLSGVFAYAPATDQNVEMVVAVMTAVALGLLAVQIAATQLSAVPLAAAALALTFIAKSVAVWSMARAASPFQWLTPGVTGGTLVGIAILALLIWLPAAWRSALAIGCLLTGVTLVNITPENPYQSTPAYLLASQRTHLSSFSAIVRVLSQLWPFATIALLCVLARGPRQPLPAETTA